MQERHSEFDAAVRMGTRAIHLLVHDGRSVREQVVSFSGDVLARFGDPTPVLIDPASRTPAEIVRETLAETAEDLLQGRRVLVLAPNSWGPHRHDLIAASLSELGALPTVHPETDFVFQHRADAPGGEDRTLWLRVGSEVTTAALVHRSEDSWVQAHRVEVHWGGDDIDDQLVRFVSRRLPESATAEDLRTACREAREGLSGQVTAAVTTSTGSVYLHRKDVEELAGPSARAALNSTIGQVLALSDQAVTSVLVSGGTARTPLVAQLASEISGQPISLVDWRDSVSPLLVRPQVHDRAVAPERNDTLPLTDQQALPQRPAQHRRRAPLLAGVAGGVAVLAFAVVGASQIGGGTDLLRGLLGGNSASVPGGPPGAYAATQSPAPASSEGPGSPTALTNSVAYGQAGQPGQPSGRPGAAPNAPEGSPAAPGVPSNPAAAAPANPASPAAPPNAPAPAPAAPAPAPAPPAPVTSAPPSAPPADPPPPTSSAPPRTSAPPTTQAPVPADPSPPADPEPSPDAPAPADSATPDASAP